MKQRRSLTLLASASVGFFALALSGCAAEDAQPNTGSAGAETGGAKTADTAPGADEQDAPSNDVGSEGGSAGKGEATLTVGDVTYTADLQFCSLTDGQDALFHGLAYDEAGTEVGYLDGDFGIDGGNAFGEARIDFGATGQFESTDEFIAIGDARSSIVIAAFSDTNWNIIGGAWDQNGNETPSSTLRVEC